MKGQKHPVNPVMILQLMILIPFNFPGYKVLSLQPPTHCWKQKPEFYSFRFFIYLVLSNCS